MGEKFCGGMGYTDDANITCKLKSDKCHFTHMKHKWTHIDMTDVDGKIIISRETCDLLGGQDAYHSGKRFDFT